VAPKIHAVVQDADDFDRAPCPDPVHQEVSSATAMARNVERAEACHDLVSGLETRNIGTGSKFANRLNNGVAVHSGLPRAKILSRPFQDICKIELCGSAETNPPSALDHQTPIRLFWK
jgi:hypothetical protein